MLAYEDLEQADWVRWSRRAGAIAPTRAVGDSPFDAVWAAWARAGRQGLLERRRMHDPAAGPSVEIDSALETSLLGLLEERLREVGHPALTDHCRSELGPSPSLDDVWSWTAGHLADGFARLLDAIPVWGRLLGVAVGQWFDATDELLSRLDRDRTALQDRLGLDVATPIVAVDRCGDCHHGGREVLVLHAADGTRIVYKPRPIDGEMLVARAAAHLRAHRGVDVDLVPTFLDRGTHGWSEFIESAPPADAAATDRYLRRAGALIVLARTLGIADLHAENIVVAGDRPVAVDLECVAHPVLADTDPSAPVTASAIGDDPLLRTFLLPRCDDPDGPDAHGLAATPTDDGPLALAPLLDGMERARRTIATAGLGVTVSQPIRTRLVPEHTSVYERILRRSRRARHLVDGATYRAFIDRALAETTDAPPPGSPLRDTLRRQLEQLDIPVVTTWSTSRHGTSAGRTIANLTIETGAELVARTTARLTDPADAHFAADVVRISWDQRHGPTDPGPATHDPHGAAVDVAADLAARLVERAIRWPDETLRWVTMDSTRHGLVPAIGDRGLYDGSAGIAWFIASAAVTTGCDHAARIAIEALAPGPDESVGPDLASGRAGVGLARVAVGRLCGDDALVYRGVEDLARLDGAEHHRSTELDWLAGRSGCVAAIGAAAAVTGSDRLAEICEREARRLKAAWTDARSRGGPYTVAALRLGAAHGITGVLAAAGRSHSLRDDEELGDWAAELVALENDRIAGRDGVPSRRTRPHRTPEPGWCWGVSGHLVVRRALAAWTDLDDLDTHFAVGEAIADASPTRTDRLCCGTAAAVAALPPGSETQARAVSRLTGGEGLISEAGASFPGSSLFRGIAGMGQVLLRTADPALPDPLTLDLGQTRPHPPLGPGRRAPTRQRRLSHHSGGNRERSNINDTHRETTP